MAYSTRGLILAAGDRIKVGSKFAAMEMWLMPEEKVTVSVGGLSRLRSAVERVAGPEVALICEAVIADLSSRPATGILESEGSAPRHMWDEYCWNIQAGPFDDHLSFGEQDVGSISGGFDDFVYAIARAEIEALPEHLLILLSTYAFALDFDLDDDKTIGDISISSIVEATMEQMKNRASERRLQLIGPDQSDAIQYTIGDLGMIWDLLNEPGGQALGLVTDYVDTILDPDADVSDLASDMVEVFMACVTEDLNETVYGAALLETFDNEIRTLLVEPHLNEMLKKMRTQLLESLDG